jgi:regulator of sigma E protease
LHGCLIAAQWYLDPSVWLNIAEVALGLGFVIFVHELGHFTVAKLCGVKVEKFFLGFDIGGLKLLHFRYGETLYGIGIVPLGGYVKMLGQEDNPARLREEIDRARQTEPTEAAGGEVPAAAGDVAEKRSAVFDPRSYLAQSVPRRMAIISAGVVMNLIFAWLAAVVAFGWGVRQIAPTIGEVMAGGGAWQAGLRLGDEVLDVGGRKIHIFRDMQEAIALGDVENGVSMTVRRPGVAKPLQFLVKTQRMAGRPTIGIGNYVESKLVREKGWPPVYPGSAASRAEPPFEPGDRIEKIDNQPIRTYTDMHAYLGLHADQRLMVGVRRAGHAAVGGSTAGAAGENRTTAVDAAPMRHFGLIMEMGEITAVQEDSPAKAVGIRTHDLLKTCDGRPVGDPMTLPDRFRRLAGRQVTLGLLRDGKPLEIKATPRHSDQYASSAAPKSSVAVAELGLAYQVSNVVRSVEDGGPAAKAGLRPGDVLHQARIVPPDEATLNHLRKVYHQPDLEQHEEKIPFTRDLLDWPCLMTLVQMVLPGTTVELAWTRGDKEMTATLEPVAAADWYNPSRGWIFEPKTIWQTADNLAEAFRWGGRETVNATLVVYRVLQKVGSGQISPLNFGGPLEIFRQALRAAEQGLGNFLLFLTMLSANLAVLNFLPIPVFDGGHFVLLLWEGIRGKPADERVQEVLTYLGLAFILALMLFVLGLDFGFISRQSW